MIFTAGQSAWYPALNETQSSIIQTLMRPRVQLYLLNVYKYMYSLLIIFVACEEGPVGDSRVQSRANGMKR